jgi:hypothetical protein
MGHVVTAISLGIMVLAGLFIVAGLGARLIMRWTDLSGDIGAGVGVGFVVGIGVEIGVDLVVAFGTQVISDLLNGLGARHAIASAATVLVSRSCLVLGGLTTVVGVVRLGRLVARRVDFGAGFVRGLIVGLGSALVADVVPCLFIDVYGCLVFMLGVGLGVLVVGRRRAGSGLGLVGAVIGAVVGAVVIAGFIIAGVVVDLTVGRAAQLGIRFATILDTVLQGYLLAGLAVGFGTSLGAMRLPSRKVVGGVLMSLAVLILPTHERATRGREWGGELDYLNRRRAGGVLRLSIGFVVASIRMQVVTRLSEWGSRSQGSDVEQDDRRSGTGVVVTHGMDEPQDVPVVRTALPRPPERRTPTAKRMATPEPYA